MSISFNGFNEKAITLKTTSQLAKNSFVKISANDTVAACAQGDVFCGIVATSDKKYATVITSGTVTVPFTGTAPTLGFCKLAANGTNGVCVDSTDGRTCLVLNSKNNEVTFIF